MTFSPSLALLALAGLTYTAYTHLRTRNLTRAATLKDHLLSSLPSIPLSSHLIC